MTDEIYRFQVYFPVDQGERRFVKFIADIRTQMYPDFRSRIAGLIELRGGNPLGIYYSQHEAFKELWNAWEKQNKKLASTLPAEFPERLLALKELRQDEYGGYSNPNIMMELWNAWCREFPKEAAKIERKIKKAKKMAAI